MIRVVNTRPLIFLGKLERLELLRIGGERVVAPEAVIAEIEVRADIACDRFHDILGEWLEAAKLYVPEPTLLIPDFGPGEVEVMLLARRLGTRDVVLDDLDARRYARRMGLEPIGTLGCFWRERTSASLYR